ncbi:LOW QUALITY PROTEIN: hypothetical protein KUTeg_012886 [Tegillarca granosa]|uniref:Chromatin-remodeling ATPase INO80 n=1 Tax=Tegillarca granosa TaxID=220873 RepID=A0ABQ9EVK5_TEGGR|nr:LOW QUALITY PROTEIN: hypothetical protein KUTeg_012886 [Tegillarca granosa]
MNKTSVFHRLKHNPFVVLKTKYSIAMINIEVPKYNEVVVRNCTFLVTISVNFEIKNKYCALRAGTKQMAGDPQHSKRKVMNRACRFVSQASASHSTYSCFVIRHICYLDEQNREARILMCVNAPSSRKTSLEHNYGQLAKPLHIQTVENALCLEPFLTYVEDLIKETDQDREKGRQDKNILLSDSSSDEDEEKPITTEELHAMLRTHRQQRKYQINFYQEQEHHQYQYYSTGLLSNYDKYYEHQKNFAGAKKKISKDHKKFDKKMKGKLKKLKKEKMYKNGDDEEEIDPLVFEAYLAHRRSLSSKSGSKSKKLTPEQADIKRKRLWLSITKKEIPKIAQQCMRECRRAAIQSQKTMKETPSRAKRLTREMLSYWKRFEKVEKEHRKKAEKEAQEQRKFDLELREAKRQQRKLNFLITQTELYAHFMARKMTGENEETRDKILSHLDENKPQKQFEVQGGVLTDVAGDDYDSERVKQLALKNAEDAYKVHRKKQKSFDDDDSSFANPSTISSEMERPQPLMFEGILKAYQLKGMNWLANLYDQGINGILADEMGLGKTVQSIALLAHLAEAQGIWGPFLVVAPASTLHNWQQECARFLPKFKVVPYWGNSQDRRILRKFWDSKCLHTEEASFHVVITSYQLVIQDVKYFQRVKWQYMILDEAQALKSSSSVRWKILLGFNCRNRLLLTGTPIQNSMAELWALLHFIMPTLFDSHDEFNEWFSKDIESHVEKQSGIDADQLSRLHMILKPFMLRRVKKDVENELSDKIEILVYCPLTRRQKMLYQAIKNKISIEDLLQSTTSSTSQSQNTTSSLMNLVMQFRKRREVKSPFFMKLEPYQIPKLLYRDGILDSAVPSKKKILHNLFYIHSPNHVHHSLFPHSDTKESSCFSFTRFINLSPQELYEYMAGGILVRWLAIFLWLKMAYRIHHFKLWSEEIFSRFQLLLYPEHSLSFTNVESSTLLKPLVFVSHTSPVYTFTSHTLHYIPETNSHLKIRLSNQKAAFHLKSPPHSPTKVGTSHCKWYCPDRTAEWQLMKDDLCGTLEGRNTLLYGSQDIYTTVRWLNPWQFFTTQPSGLLGLNPTHGWSDIFSPDKEILVTDAGKLHVLDSLLQRLKSENHREYMWYRKHTYMRLDGSSKISDRRDMVADFQNRSDIFVFLLSTRAGGLGINLTAADTVIFYDSDWNPTVDQQAMDRAHRLGQTKQVTVYRLVCKGSIEERILQRAKEKSEIQRMVISGGNFRPDVLKPKEVVSLLIDDDEMETKLKQRQDERNRDASGKEKEKKRKRDVQVKMSYGSEFTQQSSIGLADDSSNDALVIVDDSLSAASFGQTPKGRGKRGRPKGSTGTRRPRGRGGVKKSLSAAEIAGAQAGMTAAYAAYGYNFTGMSPSSKNSNVQMSSTDSPKSSSPLSSDNKT